MDSLHEKKIFLFLGETGSGKTTLINYFYNYFNGERNCSAIRSQPELVKIAIPNKYWVDNVVEEYKDQDSEQNIQRETESQTSECISYNIELNESLTLALVDSPGFNNKNGIEIDDQTFKKIKKTCLKYEYLNGIFLVINGTSPRLNDSTKSFMEYLFNLFPEDIKNNILVVFTNCDDTSCNFETNSLQKLLENPKIFYMQNNLFKWDKNELNDKRWRFFNRDWIDSCETVKEILNVTKPMKPIKTDSLKIIDQKKNLLIQSFKKEIQHSLRIIDAINEIEFKSDAIKEALKVKKQNLIHEKEYIIEAIPFVQDNKKKNKKISTKLKKVLHISTKSKSDKDSTDNGRSNTFQTDEKSLMTESKRKEESNSDDDEDIDVDTNKIDADIQYNQLMNPKSEKNSEQSNIKQSSTELAEKISNLDLTKDNGPNCSNEYTQSKISSNANLNEMEPKETNLKEKQICDKPNPDFKRENLRNNTNRVDSKESKDSIKQPDKKLTTVNLNFKFKDEAAINQFEKATMQIESAEREIESKQKEIDDLRQKLAESLNSISVIIIEIRSLIQGFNFFSLFYPIIENITKTSKSSNSDILDEYIKCVKGIIEQTNNKS